MAGICTGSKKSEPIVIRGDQSAAKALRKKRATSPADAFSDSLATGVELLIAHGHPPTVVWSYTIPAIQTYVDLITARQRQRLHDLTVAVRHTQGTDSKVFREFLTSLQGDD